MLLSFPPFYGSNANLNGQINGVSLRHKLEMMSNSQESTLRQTLHVRIVKDTQNIQFMDWPQCV